MSTYQERLRNDKKVELSQRVVSAIVDDIWCMSYMAADDQEFVDYLMTVTDQNAIEEFFNKCHDQGGRFCGGSSGSGRGPGTHKPAPIDYIKQQIREKAKITSERVDSAPLRNVSTSPGRNYLLSEFNPSGFGTVKIHRLQKANLTQFSTKDLTTLKTRLQASQRQYNKMNTIGWAEAASGAAGAALVNPVLGGAVIAGAAINIGVSRWKTKRIPIQITRIDRSLARRTKLSSEDHVELAQPSLDDSGESEANLPSLEQEIAAARKEIESGNFPKVAAPSKGDLQDVENLLSEIEDDDDLTSEQIKGIKDSFADYKKSV